MFYRMAILALIAGSSCAHSDNSTAGGNMKTEDPYIWLEEVEGKKSLDWVKFRNEGTLKELTSDPQYNVFNTEALKILNAKDKIPYGRIRGEYIYNFWQDKKNVRGLWRRATKTEYLKPQTQWETILDFDELAKSENENWVFKGSHCHPNEPRCLLTLSRGGKDASVVREFDLQTKSFVDRGFSLPEAKSSVDWLDLDHVLVSTDYGPNSLTDSGYPRIVKKWTRGKPLAEAEIMFTADKTDVSAYASSMSGSSGDYVFIGKAKTFYTSEKYVAEDKSVKELVLLPIPEDAEVSGVFNDQLLIVLRSDWESNNKKMLAGDLLSIDLKEFFRTKKLPVVEIMFSPNMNQAMDSVQVSKNAVFVSILEDVKARVLKFVFEGGRWSQISLTLPSAGSLSLVHVDSNTDEIFLDFQSYLTPAQLYWGKDTSIKPEVVKELPARFDSSGKTTKQYFATSKDGAKIPYFVVGPKNMKIDSSNKTLLYGYGGFEQSMTPYYSSTVGKFWLEQGGVYVVANIRGGGEYGPRWHQAALKENRQVAFDDFIAVGEDLIAQGITDSNKLGIMGGSNGGLLVGAVMVQRPELFKAVVCQVPLLDMLRYHKLLAGASWMGEYGNPDKPNERAFIERYSPYQNLKSGKDYPKVFFVTSTKDDRVHPGHARKMAARLEEFGEDFYYFENIDGGHAAGANLVDTAKRISLEYVYLHKMLADTLASK